MNKRPIYVVAAAFVLAIVVLPAQSIGAQSQGTDGMARLRAAEQAQTLDDPALKPWHLKMDVRLFDTTGKITEAGTLEEWWAAPDRFRRVFSLSSYSATELKNAHGFFRTKGSGRPPYVLSRLLKLVEHPIQAPGDSGDVIAELREEKVKSVELDCIDLRPRAKGPSNVTLATYCLGRGGAMLLLNSDKVQTSEPGSVGKFQGRDVPIDLNLYLAHKEVADEHIEVLETLPEAAQIFDNTDGLASAKDDPIMVGADVLGGGLIKSVPPIYPPLDKESRTTGMVVLDAIIGSDGHVQDLTSLSSPDGGLTASAMTAVRQWTYEPFLVHGSPVDIERVVAVNYSIEIE